jgi:hypothetical protein
MCGNTLVIGDPKFVEAHVQKALRAGQTVMEKGVSRHINNNVVFDHTKSGSAAYTWRGDKVKHERVLCTKYMDGHVELERVGFCFLKWNV